MIRRELKPVQVISFAPGVDAYGQKHKGQRTSRFVEMAVTTYQQKNVQDIRYIEVTDLGLTADTSITDSDQILVDGNTFKVLYTIPSKRFTQVFMKRV